jgi:4-hydroxybenzoate polyprenyltransferase
MFRVLAILQLTRAALAFTAVADAWAVLLLRVRPEGPLAIRGEESWVFWLTILKMLVVAVASLGLYGFGTTLNDLLDARRDRIFEPGRPIPSGSIKPRGAVVVGLALLMAALLAAALLTLLHVWEMNLANRVIRVRDIVPYSFFFALATAALIVFYNATAKYLGGLGLLSLGLIRALHCLIGKPSTPVMFLSMILLTHVVIVSAVAYSLQNKRPRLTRRGILGIVLGVLLANGILLWYTVTRRQWQEHSADILPMLLGPAVVGGVYVLWAVALMLRKRLMPRQKGERLELMGVFWLFMYDASLLIGNGQFLAGGAITLLLILAVGSFLGIRWFSHGSILPRVGYRMERAPSSSGG